MRCFLHIRFSSFLSPKPTISIKYNGWDVLELLETQSYPIHWNIQTRKKKVIEKISHPSFFSFQKTFFHYFSFSLLNQIQSFKSFNPMRRCKPIYSCISQHEIAPKCEFGQQFKQLITLDDQFFLPVDMRNTDITCWMTQKFRKGKITRIRPTDIHATYGCYSFLILQYG